MKRLELLAFLLIVTACTPGEQVGEGTEDRQGPPQVYTVNYPLAYFAERIAGDSVEVVFPVPADTDPATWSPAADTVAEYQQADLVLLNGAGYAGWIQRATLSQSRLIDTSAAFADSLIPVADDVTHSHGPAGDHSHGGTAFTTWLDFELAIGQSQAVCDALIRLRPEYETEFRGRLSELERDLRELDEDLNDVARRIGGAPLFFSHPVYQYLVRRYELNGRSLHWEPQEIPDEEQWRELSAARQNHAAVWLIWEGEPHPNVVNRLADMGIESIVFRPSDNRPAEGDYISAMQENVRVLQQAFPPATL